MKTNPYQSPQSDLEIKDVNRDKPTEFIITMAVVLTLATSLINFRSAGIYYIGTPEKVGAAIAFIVVSAFLVLPFQLFRKYRNNSSRLKIYNWFMLVFLILTILKTLSGN